MEKIKQALTGVTQRLNKVYGNKIYCWILLNSVTKLERDIEKLEEGNLKLTQMTERASVNTYHILYAANQRHCRTLRLLLSSAIGRS